jgi:hypothetical protein
MAATLPTQQRIEFLTLIDIQQLFTPHKLIISLCNCTLPAPVPGLALCALFSKQWQSFMKDLQDSNIEDTGRQIYAMLCLRNFINFWFLQLLILKKKIKNNALLYKILYFNVNIPHKDLCKLHILKIYKVQDDTAHTTIKYNVCTSRYISWFV